MNFFNHVISKIHYDKMKAGQILKHVGTFFSRKSENLGLLLWEHRMGSRIQFNSFQTELKNEIILNEFYLTEILMDVESASSAEKVKLGKNINF